MQASIDSPGTPVLGALNIVKRLWRAVLFFIRVKKTWRMPHTREVLIFDAEGHEFLLDYLSPRKPEVLHVRGEQICMPVLLASFAGSGPLNRNRYFDRFIAAVRPRLIVTFIDNNPAFYTLAVRHPGIKTLFVQNGVKSYYLDVFETLDQVESPRERFKVDYMLTFGSRPGTEYAKYIRGTVMPIGSLRNNHILRSRHKRVGTIVFLSQFRDTRGFVMGGRFIGRQAFFEQADRLVLSTLEKYARFRGKELSIVPCSGLGGQSGDALLTMEKQYYRNILGSSCLFYERDSEGSGYDAADAADVVVTIDSALGYESAARGNKTAFFSIRSQLLGIPGLTFGWPKAPPDEGAFWTNQPDPEIFERILDYLFEIDQEEWKSALSQHRFSEIMEFDPENRIMRSLLRDALGAPPIEDGHPSDATSATVPRRLH